MKKLRIYLDTSVISHLKQNDAPEKMSDTLKLWDDIKAGKYSVFLSDTTLDEIEDCPADKLEILTEYLKGIEYTVISSNDEIEEIAQKIIDMGILRQKSYDDCIHIASAIVSECDMIVSWNFKHMANIKTIKGVRVVAYLQGYQNIDIVTPAMLIESEEDDDKCPNRF